MQNKEDILVFVLGFGVNCEVLEPEWLREALLEKAKMLFDLYTGG
jgi:predicted DNA-binding transcriptional regulator YafY